MIRDPNSVLRTWWSQTKGAAKGHIQNDITVSLDIISFLLSMPFVTWTFFVGNFSPLGFAFQKQKKISKTLTHTLEARRHIRSSVFNIPHSNFWLKHPSINCNSGSIIYSGHYARVWFFFFFRHLSKFFFFLPTKSLTKPQKQKQQNIPMLLSEALSS